MKIGSGDVNNFFVLNKIAEMTEVNAVVSTGMANFDMVENIYDMFKKHRGDLNNFVIMQCTSSYPTESKGKENFNLLITCFPEFSEFIPGSAHRTPNFTNPEFQFPQFEVLESDFFSFFLL